MWPRIAEVCIAFWLVMSPFVFGYPDRADGSQLLWIATLGSSFVIGTAALASYRAPWYRAHLISAAIGCLLAAYGYFGGGTEAPPAYQNLTITGLFVAMFAVLPSENLSPPRLWHEYYAKGANDRD